MAKEVATASFRYPGTLENANAAGGVMTLFGGRERPWNPDDWVSCDDRVRGGKSFSCLELDSDPDPALGPDGPAVAFSGFLDIQTLGGAGFASHRTRDGLQPLDLRGFNALVVDVPRSDKKIYTLILKDTLPAPPAAPRPEPQRIGDWVRPTPAHMRREHALSADGHDRSSVSWEHNFNCPGRGGSGRVVLHLADFRPMYRGRPENDAPPLNLASIKRVGIMLRSFFGQQQDGAFCIILLSITAHQFRTPTETSPSSYQSLSHYDRITETPPTSLPPTSRSGTKSDRVGVGVSESELDSYDPRPEDEERSQRSTETRQSSRRSLLLRRFLGFKKGA